GRLGKERSYTDALTCGGVAIWMRAAVEPIVAEHDAHVAANDRTQLIVTFVEPLQPAKRPAIVAPFGRSVVIGFLGPGFTFGQAVSEQFREPSEFCIDD